MRVKSVVWNKIKAKTKALKNVIFLSGEGLEMKEVKGKHLAGWVEEGSSPPVGGAGGLIRGRSVRSQPSESSIQPWCNKNTIIERSPPPTTTYYTNNTLSFCLLMIYFLNISHTLDLISLLLKCKLGSLPLQHSVAQMNFRTRRRLRRQTDFLLQGCFQKSCSKTAANQSKTDLHDVRVLELLQAVL